MNFLKGLLLVATVATLSACGNTSSLVEKVSVKTNVDANQDTWVTMDSQLNMGALSFPALTIPIANPKFPSEMLGSVSLQRTLDGKNVLEVSANLSEISKNKFTQDNLLPNGSAIPVAGLDGVIAVKFNTASKVYIGGSANSIMFGVALAIPLFDNVGKYLPGLNMFLPLPTQSGIEGLGGVFTGATGLSGLGLFVKVPNTININSANTLAAASTSSLSVNSASAAPDLSGAKAISAKVVSSASSMKFISSNENTSANKNLKRMLLNLGLQKRTLTVK